MKCSERGCEKGGEGDGGGSYPASASLPGSALHSHWNLHTEPDGRKKNNNTFLISLLEAGSSSGWVSLLQDAESLSFPPVSPWAERKQEFHQSLRRAAEMVTLQPGSENSPNWSTSSWPAVRHLQTPQESPKFPRVCAAHVEEASPGKRKSRSAPLISPLRSHNKPRWQLQPV